MYCVAHGYKNVREMKFLYNYYVVGSCGLCRAPILTLKFVVVVPVTKLKC